VSAGRRASRALLVAVALGAPLGGCGGGPSGSAGGGEGQASRALRWLVPTHGSAPSVAQENGHRGTDAWRLPGGHSRGHIDAYVSAQDALPGSVQRIYVRAPRARTVTMRIFRMGWYGGAGGREILTTAPLAVSRQPPCAHDQRTGLTECRWHPTLSLTLPRSLPSGVYLVKIADDRRGERYCLFVLEPERPTPMLAQISTASWEAYNYWGGDSLYPGGHRVGVTGGTQGVEVSYDRPYDSVDGAGQYFRVDAPTVRFLERYGYPISYITGTGLDRSPRLALGARALMDIGHSEYWSQRAERAFERARDRGINLAFLSSDTLAWRVRYAPATPSSSETGEPGHVIVAYKERAALDPVRAPPTGAFPHNGAPLTGSAYVGCITARVPNRLKATYRLYAWSPAPGLSPPWLFAGTGFTPGARVMGILGYELDQRVAASPPGTQVLGSGSAPCMSGVGLGQTTLYRAASGALVFATGTVGWALGLDPQPDVSPDAPRREDPRLIRLTRNLLERVVQGPAGA